LTHRIAVVAGDGPLQVGLETSVFTRGGVRRAVEHAFALVASRRGVSWASRRPLPRWETPFRLRCASPLVLLAIAAAGCGASHNVTVSATPAESLVDEPVDVVVHGLAPGAPATIRLTSTDAAGTPWSASARFRTAADGTIDLARNAPVSGYPGAWELGLNDYLEPARALAAPYYHWHGTQPQTFRVSVEQGGHAVARTSYVRRETAARLVHATTTVAHDGFVGWYAAPASARRCSIVLWGGSEGGLSRYLVVTADLLAAHGCAALAVGYWALPGTRQELSLVPLEYFARAIHWLQRRTGSSGRVTVLGVSRGSEAAQLVGADFPSLVDRVVAVVPSSVVNAAWPLGAGSAWTLHGRPLPYEHAPRWGDPADRAAIPVERIAGPLLTICAGLDELWPSCIYAKAIHRRRVAHGVSAHDLSITAPGADHEQTATLVEGFPGLVALNLAVPAIVPAERDRERIWPRLLRFLGATP
jgi:acyl-CoA thioester hydrolase/bile acid acetyltransferase-like protein/bile acid acyltransferase/acyl-CoA thioester hydrolase-like protein